MFLLDFRHVRRERNAPFDQRKIPVFFTELVEKKVIAKKEKITGHSKKVYHDLDLIETCGFLHGVQHVSINIFEAFLDVAIF